jgi:hypothetical protein
MCRHAFRIDRAAGINQLTLEDPGDPVRDAAHGAGAVGDEDQRGRSAMRWR